MRAELRFELAAGQEEVTIQPDEGVRLRRVIQIMAILNTEPEESERRSILEIVEAVRAQGGPDLEEAENQDDAERFKSLWRTADADARKSIMDWMEDWKGGA